MPISYLLENFSLLPIFQYWTRVFVLTSLRCLDVDLITAALVFCDSYCVVKQSDKDGPAVLVCSQWRCNVVKKKKKEDSWNICVPEPLQSCAHVWSCVTNLKQLWLVSVDVSLPVCLWCCEVYVLVNHHLWWHPMTYSIVTLSFPYIFFYKWKKCCDVSISEREIFEQSLVWSWAYSSEI